MSCPCHTCLLLPDLPVLTMYCNKALRMDPLASRLVNPVTEYSATQGSSGFHEQYWPGMYTARLLLFLKQGKRSLEDFIQEYLDVANDSDFPDDVLIDFFCDGINQPLKSQLIREGPRSSLSFFGLCFAVYWLFVHGGCRGRGKRHCVHV